MDTNILDLTSKLDLDALDPMYTYDIMIKETKQGTPITYNQGVRHTDVKALIAQCAEEYFHEKRSYHQIYHRPNKKINAQD